VKRPSFVAITVAATVALFGPALSADATAGDIGHLDQSFTGVSNPPTSDKPQSKLWYVDGSWFADMWNSSAVAWHIYRLDRSTEHWVDTNVSADTRAGALADTLWDGSHLYIASHVVSYNTEAAPKASVLGKPAKLYRYSYSATTKSFTLNSGFPTTIANYSSESMTIDKDSTGRLWATWTQVSGDSTVGFTNAVYVNATGTTGTTWGVPFLIPAAGNAPAPDDISSVVAFGKNKIGVLWSNQLDQSVYWAVHNDGDAVATWHAGVALKGNKQADDHMNLKSIQADPSGRVFAAVKTSADEVAGAVPTDAQILLLVFKPGTGSWSSTVFGTLADCHTRPQVVLDETNSIVNVVATGPSSSTGCPAPGTPGTIYEKSAPMDNPVFPAGRGTPIIRDAASANMNNATTSKQPVNSASGMVVLAGNSSTKRYWHADLPVAGTGVDVTPPSTPTNLTATASTATAVDLAWSASTDDVGVTGYNVYRDSATTPLATTTSTSYTDSTVAASTAYTYQVSAVDAAGNESGKASVSVTTPSAATTTTLTFAPAADAQVVATSPDTNYGTAGRLAADASPLTNSFLKFNVTGTSGCTISKAVLRLTVGSDSTDNAPYGGDFYPVADTTWSETGVTWNNQPAAGTTKVASIPGAVALNTTYTVTVTPLITGDGLVSMRLSSPNADAARYWSKEGSTAAQAPQLQVTCG
jgi:hypothetical protein